MDEESQHLEVVSMISAGADYSTGRNYVRNQSTSVTRKGMKPAEILNCLTLLENYLVLQALLGASSSSPSRFIHGLLLLRCNHMLSKYGKGIKESIRMMEGGMKSPHWISARLKLENLFCFGRTKGPFKGIRFGGEIVHQDAASVSVGRP